MSKEEAGNTRLHRSPVILRPFVLSHFDDYVAFPQHESENSDTTSRCHDDDEQFEHEGEEGGSSVGQAVFNFTNVIVGAGAIGLGGAIASSGGAISIALLLFFAALAKSSVDLVISLSLQVQQQQGGSSSVTYEDLGRIAFPRGGQTAVVLSKFLYAFGCLVAYVIVVKDNFGPALFRLIYGRSYQTSSWFARFLIHDVWTTLTLSATIMLPLCLLRDMTPFANFSVISIVSMISIVVIVIWLFIEDPHNVREATSGSVFENWWEVRSGVFESLGTFVFTFVAQHTVHLVFGSLKPSLQTLRNWKTVSTCSYSISSIISLTVGLFVYMTFWGSTKSDIFELYPAFSCKINLAKLLLSWTMLFTFPLPFFTCRELLIVSFITPVTRKDQQQQEADDVLQEPLLLSDDREDDESSFGNPLRLEAGGSFTVCSSRESSALPPLPTAQPSSPLLLPNNDRQLIWPYHFLLTFFLWAMVTALAIAAPSLGDVLDLVGCASGTMIAFVLPALFAIRVQGKYTPFSVFLLVVGGTVGLVGTWFSLRKLLFDVMTGGAAVPAETDGSKSQQNGLIM